MTACHAVDTDSNSVLGVIFSHFSGSSGAHTGDGRARYFTHCAIRYRALRPPTTTYTGLRGLVPNAWGSITPALKTRATFAKGSRRVALPRLVSTVSAKHRRPPSPARDTPERLVSSQIIPDAPQCSNPGDEKLYIGDFNFISLVKYIYHNAASGLMHAPEKRFANDPVFETLGTLILGTGLLVFVSLVLYASGFLA